MQAPRDPNTPPDVRWFYGPTGAGKSKYAYELFHPIGEPGLDGEAKVGAYYKSADHKWWDGYDGVSPVIIDDYRCNFCTFSALLRLLDRYPVQVECKGGTMQFNARTIIVTAPHHPREMWNSRTAEDLQQLLRRITEIRCFPHRDQPSYVEDPEPLDVPLGAAVAGFYPH